MALATRDCRRPAGVPGRRLRFAAIRARPLGPRSRAGRRHAERHRHAIELAQRHAWPDSPFSIDTNQFWSETAAHTYDRNLQNQTVGRIGWTAMLWDDGQSYDLNQLTGFTSSTTHPLYGSVNYRLRAAMAINDQGQILAIASNGLLTGMSGDIYLLTPKDPETQDPEPTTPIPEASPSLFLWLFGLALIRYLIPAHLANP